MIPDKIPSQSNARTARQLLRTHRYGALSTLSKKYDGHPFGSITPYLVDHDGSLLIFISDLAEHTKNIKHDPRVSLVTHNQHDPRIQTQGRVTVIGMAAHVAAREQAGRRYLRHFPEAQTYYDMQDFQFYRITPQAIRYIGGFGDIHWMQAENYRIPPYPLILEEERLIEEINRDHAAALAAKLASPARDATQLIGVDCDGFDLRAGDLTLRSEFPAMMLDAARAHGALLDMLAKG